MSGTFLLSLLVPLSLITTAAAGPLSGGGGFGEIAGYVTCEGRMGEHLYLVDIMSLNQTPPIARVSTIDPETPTYEHLGTDFRFRALGCVAVDSKTLFHCEEYGQFRADGVGTIDVQKDSQGNVSARFTITGPGAHPMQIVGTLSPCSLN